jgi:hypothetical protein
MFSFGLKAWLMNHSSWECENSIKVVHKRACNFHKIPSNSNQEQGNIWNNAVAFVRERKNFG